MHKQVLALLLAGLAVTACGGSPSEPSNSKLRVGVLFPGNLSDDGFMESSYGGYQRLEQAGQVELAKIEQVPAADYQQALSTLAAKSDLVVAFGGQTDAVLRQVAPTFPKVKFVEVGGPSDAVPLANLAYYDPKQADGGLLSGAYAALTSKSGKVAFVGGLELPAIVNTANEFAKGAKLAKNDIEVLAPQYVGDFNDVAKAKQAGQALVGGGADVFGQQLNLGRQGLVQAAGEGSGSVISGPLVKECGSEAGVIGYAKTDTGAALEYAVKAVLDGSWKAEQKPFGVASGLGASDLVLCGASPEVTAKLDEIKKQLASGAIKTP